MQSAVSHGLESFHGKMPEPKPSTKLGIELPEIPEDGEDDGGLKAIAEAAWQKHPQDHEAAKKEYVARLMANRSVLALENLERLAWDSARVRIGDRRHIAMQALSKSPNTNVPVSTPSSIRALGNVFDTSHFLDNWGTRFGKPLSECTGDEVRALREEAGGIADGWHRREKFLLFVEKRTPEDRKVKDCIKATDAKAKKLYAETITEPNKDSKRKAG